MLGPRTALQFLYTFIISFLIIGFRADCAPAQTTRIPQWSLFEVQFDPGVNVANPFDPAQADVRGEFVAPGGRVFTSPAFAYKEYTREIVGGAEKLMPVDQGSAEYVWTLRFTPTRRGTWKWRWVAKTSDAIKKSAWAKFKVEAPEKGNHGFLRVSRNDKRYLVFDDGAPFFAIGENVGWADNRGTAAYDDWLQKVADNGGNYVRVWFASWGFALEWTGGSKLDVAGNYMNRMDRAWQLDYVIKKAASLGIYVMLCIQNHGPFSYDTNPEWKDNPYNAANGGPIAEASGIFTDPVAKELFKRRLRYIVARWGYSPNVLCWELWNEVNAADRPADSVVAAWHAEMSRTLKTLDPNRHLVTTSVVNDLNKPGLGDALWKLPGIDFTQIHMYAGYPMKTIDFTKAIPEYADWASRFGKPVIAAEVGVDWRGMAETLKYDPSSSGFHDALWMGLFAQTIGTGMTWWWDNLVESKNLYAQFAPVASFVRGVNFPKEKFVPGGASVDFSGKRKPEAFALRGKSTALVWVKDSKYVWYMKRKPVAIDGAKLWMDGLRNGNWIFEWMDAYTGKTIAKGDVKVRSRKISLDVPAFSKDIALRMRHK